MEVRRSSNFQGDRAQVELRQNGLWVILSGLLIAFYSVLLLRIIISWEVKLSDLTPREEITYWDKKDFNILIFKEFLFKMDSVDLSKGLLYYTCTLPF